jgi:hypothetical protein
MPYNMPFALFLTNSSFFISSSAFSFFHFLSSHMSRQYVEDLNSLVWELLVYVLNYRNGANDDMSLSRTLISTLSMTMIYLIVAFCIINISSTHVVAYADVTYWFYMYVFDVLELITPLPLFHCFIDVFSLCAMCVSSTHNSITSQTIWAYSSYHEA